MPFEKFKASHGGEGPFKVAYGALFPEGIIGRRGLANEREQTDSLIASIEADDELGGLDALLEAGRSPLTREEHAKFRSALEQAALDQKTVASAFERFQDQQRQLMELNPADHEQLSTMGSQMELAHDYLMSANPDLQRLGATIAGKVVDAQQAYATTNEAQRIALGDEKWSRFQQIGDDLRQDSLPYQQQARAWGAVNASLQNNSAAGDLALVYGAMHVIEPGSAVQQGELANAANAAGVPDFVITAYNRLLRDGERLTPEERKQFYTLARDVMKNANGQQLERNSRAIDAGRAGDIGEPYLQNLGSPIAPLGEPRTEFGTQAPPAAAPGADPNVDSRARRVGDSLREGVTSAAGSALDFAKGIFNVNPNEAPPATSPPPSGESFQGVPVERDGTARGVYVPRGFRTRPTND